MGRAIAVRTDFTAGEVRRFAKQAKDSGQTRRLLAIAAVLDGASREDAAKTGGMDRQTLRGWVIRFNEQGPDGRGTLLSDGQIRRLRLSLKKVMVHRFHDNYGNESQIKTALSSVKNAEVIAGFG